jgi:ABC-2 type transport system ATP-binding protein
MEHKSKEYPILQIKNLSKSYQNKEIIKDATFDIYEGEILGILGLSGCGKSTLLKMICGYTSEDSGKISIPHSKKKRRFTKDSSDIRKMIGFSSQEPSFYPELTVSENLIYFGTILNMKGIDLQNKIDDVLKTLDLSDVKKVQSSDLSEGMKKRLDIACSIIHMPQILILDEPTANLDYILRKELLDYVKKINEKHQITILFVSHYLEEISFISNRVLLLVKKEISIVKNSSNLKEQFTELVRGKK